MIGRMNMRKEVVIEWENKEFNEKLREKKNLIHGNKYLKKFN